uniref:Uncharacterized protein n=1 Tax=Octopus bimaculoides TaxID=37653 RepID=A0A0L8FMV8_OCTBM
MLLMLMSLIYRKCSTCIVLLTVYIRQKFSKLRLKTDNVFTILPTQTGNKVCINCRFFRSCEYSSNVFTTNNHCKLI